MDVHAYEHAVTAHWPDGFDEARLQAWAQGLRGEKASFNPDLGLVFLTPKLFPHAAQVLEILRVHAHVPLLIGCSGHSLIVAGKEIENTMGLVVGLYRLPGARLQAFHLTQSDVEEASQPGYWHALTRMPRQPASGWLAFADPFSLDGEAWLTSWNEAFPAIPTMGGLASGGSGQQRTQLYLNGEVFEEGAVVLSVGGAVRLAGVVSQGCTPIGQPWTITRAEGNLIKQIANRPAYEVLVDTFNDLPEEQQRRVQGNLFVGLVINEYQEEYHRGDFLIRNLLGFDPSSGVVAVGAHPRAGQSVQFQTRDAMAATEDLEELLERAKAAVGGKRLYGACLCNCNGRGRHLFEQSDHDASLIQQHLGPLPLTGFFCNGEIGPVGRQSFLHGYTASLALFLEK